MAACGLPWVTGCGAELFLFVSIFSWTGSIISLAYLLSKSGFLAAIAARSFSAYCMILQVQHVDFKHNLISGYLFLQPAQTECCLMLG